MDEVLKVIEEKKFPFEEEVYHHFREDINKQLGARDAVKYLETRNFIEKLEWGSKQYKIQLSTEGKKFIFEGGFVSEYNYKKDILQYSKESRDYAKRAYIIGVIGIMVGIVIFLIQKCS